MLIEILDGGMGYELNKYYSDFGKDALENNIDLITHIYNEFVKAGCEYITTCNYTCRPSLDDNWENNTKITIKIAQSVKASNTNICICCSLPPYNKSYANYEIDDNFNERLVREKNKQTLDLINQF